ncbi:unnamed protein product [Arctia plantaginis]|uniref:Sugar transporter n=1 Tax=Arctia plantaginis TaxID=874455 RepID=A0A8S0ZRC6_ARCPL|nr:unnamed protein product [Arctia plantaginis]
MDKCNYEGVKNDDTEECTTHMKYSWQPFLRQLYVCTLCTSIYFVLGLCFGAPTVYIPQLRKEAKLNLTEPMTAEMESWLSSILGYTSMPWVIILPILVRYVGRKIPFLLVTVLTFVSFIIFYCSTNAMHLLISEIIQGITLASNLTVLICIIVEYSSPRYRGVLMMIESSIFFWGVWIANVTGTFSHWRNIAIIAFVCCTYSMTAIIMPESPSWLAMMGRFDECAAAHHWLKGYDKESEDELESLIKSQKEYLKKCADRKKPKSFCQFDVIKETVTNKGFYKPLLLSMAVMSLYHFSGKLVCSMYAVDLISQITDKGAFLFYGISASIFAFILYIYLPETKDKTLQEIENYFKEAEEVDEDASKSFISSREHVKEC